MNSQNGALDFDLTVNDSQLLKSVEESKRQIAGLSKSAVNEGKKMDGAFKKVGGMVSQMIGPVTALAAAYKLQQLAAEAYEFERAFGMAMREVQTISKAVQNDFEGISAAIVDMSANAPDGAIKLAKAYYQIVSAGYDGAAGLKLLDISSKAATAGITETSVAADGLTTVLNAWGLSADKAENVADVMFKTVERGKTTFGELASSIAQVAPLAAANNISFEEIFAALQTITKQGTPTAQAMTQIRSSIINMNNVLGDGWSKTMTYQEGLNKIAKQAGGSQTALKALIPDVEAISGMLALTGEKAKGAAEDLDETTRATGSMSKAYGTMIQEADNKWSMVHNKWTREVRELGRAMKEESSNMANFMDALLSNGADIDANMSIYGIADKIKALQIMGGSTVGSYLKGGLMPESEVRAQYDQYVKTITNYAKGGLGKQQMSLGDILGIKDKDERLTKLTEFLKTLRDAEDDLGEAQFVNEEQQQAALKIRAQLWGNVEAKAREAIKAIEGEGSGGKGGNVRTLKTISDEIAAAKKLQEGAINKQDFTAIQKTIDRLETEKATIEGVKKAVDELKQAQEQFEKAVKSGDQSAINSAAKKLTALEKEEKKLKDIMALEMQRAWRSQFDGQSMSEIPSIGPKPIVQVGSQKTVKGILWEVTAIDKTGPTWERVKVEFGKLKKFEKDGNEKAAKDQKDSDEEAAEMKIRLWEDVLAAAQDVTRELTRQGLLSEAEGQAIGETLNAIASGNPVQMAALAISEIISMFPQTAAAKYAEQIEKINQALRDQQRLIDQAGRVGGESGARQKELDILKQRKAADEKALAAAQKKLDAKVFDVGPVYWDRVHKVRELTQAVKDDQAAIEDADLALQDFLAGGITQNTIADAIGQGFLDGKTSVDDFADYMNNVLLDAVTNIFKNQYLLPDIDKYLTPMITKALDDNRITEAEKKGIDDMSKFIADKNNANWNALTGALDLGGSSSSSTSPNAMTGAVQGMSENTAGLLSGQFMALRNDFKVGQDLHRQEVEIGINQTNILNASLDQLVRIGKNTNELSRLAAIESTLSSMDSSLKKGLFS